MSTSQGRMEVFTWTSCVYRTSQMASTCCSGDGTASTQPRCGRRVQTLRSGAAPLHHRPHQLQLHRVPVTPSLQRSLMIGARQIACSRLPIVHRLYARVMARSCEGCPEQLRSVAAALRASHSVCEAVLLDILKVEH